MRLCGFQSYRDGTSETILLAENIRNQAADIVIMLRILHGTIIEGKAPGIMLTIEPGIAFLKLAEHSDAPNGGLGGDGPIRGEEAVYGALEAEKVMGYDILEELGGPAAAGAMTGRNRTEDHKESS